MADLLGRVAVSGGAGFIGSHTVELLDARGAQVLVIDDLSHACGHRLPESVELVEADVDSEEATRALERFRPERVLHLATKGGVVRSLRDPAAHLQVSLVNSVAFFNAAIEAGAQAIVAASSGGTIYGETDTLPATEDGPANPVSPYGASKAAEELYLRAFAKLRRIRTLSLRYGNVYGPRQDGTGEAGLVAITSMRLLAGQPPIIYGDGLQTRDFVFVGDVARANVAALGGEESGALNVGTARESSVREVVETLTKLAGGNVRPEFEPARPGEVRRVCIDPSRAAARLGWTPEVDIEQGLRRTLEYFRSRQARLTSAG